MMQNKGYSLCGQSLIQALETSSSSVPVELLIGYGECAVEPLLNTLLKFSDLLHLYTHIPYFALRCETGDARSLVSGLEDTLSSSVSSTSLPYAYGMRSIDLSHEVTSFGGNSPPEGSTPLWNHVHIGAPDAWQHADGSGIKVAVIDTGVDYNHPELKERFGDLIGYNVISPDEPPDDDNDHGTHVAGIIAGSYTGVAPGSTLYAVKVLDWNGSGTETDVIAGLEWALDEGADIANLSLGSSGASRAFKEICERAYDAGMLIVAAAGNESHGPSYPASFGESVIAVAATDRERGHAGFSNIYHTNDISAPGVGIYSTIPGGDHDTFSGTSMATPHVSGALALASQLSRSADLEELMTSCAEQLEWPGEGGYHDVFGAGLLRVDRLVEKLVGSENRDKLRRILSRK